MLNVVAENAARLCDSMMRRSTASRVTSSAAVAHMGRFRQPRLRTDGIHHDRAGFQAEPCSIGRTIHVHDIAAESTPSFLIASRIRSVAALVQSLPRRCCEKAFRSGRFMIRRTEVRPSQKSRSRCSKPSPTKPSSLSRTCGCSKKFRSATRNCARRWSIRRQRPRCSASSAARPRTCSRCLTRSSRAPRGFVGLMM